MLHQPQQREALSFATAADIDLDPKNEAVLHKTKRKKITHGGDYALVDEV
jgi:hypothetical protein